MNPAKTISNIQYLAATAIKPLRKGDMAVALKIHEEILQHLNLMLKELQAVSVRDALSVEVLNSTSHLCDYFQKTHADEALKPTAGLFKKYADLVRVIQPKLSYRKRPKKTCLSEKKF